MSQKSSRKRKFKQTYDLNEFKHDTSPPKKKMKVEQLQFKESHFETQAPLNVLFEEKKSVLQKINEHTTHFECIVRIIFKSPTTELQIKDKKKNTFWVVVMDSTGYLLKIHFFGAACFRFQTLEVGKVYAVTNAKVQRDRHEIFAPKKLICQKITQITLQEDTTAIERQTWNVIDSILHVQSLRVGTIVDVVGVIAKLNPIEKVQNRNGNVVSKRTFELIDQTAKVEITVWEELTLVRLKEKQIVGIKKAKVTDWSGTSLTVVGFIETKPTNEIASRLKQFTKVTSDAFLKLTETTKSISVPFASQEWNSVQFLDFKQIIAAKKDFKQNATMPKIQTLRLKACIHGSYSLKFWYRKEESYHWRLYITLKSQKDPTLNFQAVCFPEGAEGITLDFSASEAAELKAKEPKKFWAKMDEILSSDKRYIFWCHFTKNSFFKTPKLDVKIVKSILI